MSKALGSSLVHDKWLFVVWNYPGQQRKTAVRELRELEKEIKSENLRGWIAETDRMNHPMRRILEKLGAVPYQVNLQSIFYQKEVI